MTPTRDPLTESPGANWHLRLASGGQYGPQSSEVMKQWLAEGRITPDALVWRDGWADWRPAGTVFPSLAAARPIAPVGAPGMAPGMHPGAIHNSGIHNSGIHNSGIHNSGIHNSGIHPGAVHPAMAPGMVAGMGAMPRPGMPGYPAGMAPGMAPGMGPAQYSPAAYAAQNAAYQPDEGNEFEVSNDRSSSSGGGYVPPRRDNTMIQASLIILVLALVVLVPAMIYALQSQPVVDRDAPNTPKTKVITKQPGGQQPPQKTRPEKKGDEKMRL